MSDPVTPPPVASPTSPGSDERLIAFISYLVLGFFIALVMQSGRKSAFAAFHLRQMFGLFLTYIAGAVVVLPLAFIPFIGWAISLGYGIFMFVLWFMGLLAAGTGKQKPLPVFGEYYQKWFASLFN